MILTLRASWLPSPRVRCSVSQSSSFVASELNEEDGDEGVTVARGNVDAEAELDERGERVRRLRRVVQRSLRLEAV